MADYISQYTGGQIDSAVGRALPGGTLEALIADNAPQNWGFGVDRLPLINKETLDARFDTGMYMFYDVVNTIDGICTGQVFIRGRNSNIGYYVVQDIWTPDSGGSASVHLHRYKVSADSDWVLEYENPPMVLGKEYCTTERYLGKPVYKMVFGFGALPNSTAKTVAHNIANIQYNIGAELTANGGCLTNLSWITDIDFDKTNISITTSMNASGHSPYVLLRYTKTTD